jgi:hypothetical protein
MGMPCKGRFMMKKVARSLIVFVFFIIVSVLPFNTALAQIGAYVVVSLEVIH